MKLFFTLIFSLLFLVTFSQTNSDRGDVGLLVGNVIELETSKAVDGATVKVTRHNDTLFARQQVTGKNGSFEFDKLPFGVYKLTISFVGLSNAVIDSIYLRAERFDFNLGDIKLQKTSTNLQEVIVYAEKPLIENTEGKITYNVGESALSSGSSTSELLKTMPMISNDPNGNILLKGKEPRILIDDKPTDLSAQQLSDLLESLPGSSIEKIELMTNPPPQYASEAGGVINIVTKKGKVGLVGRVTLTAGSRGEGNLASNVSYRHKKFTINTTVGIGASQYKGSNYSRRQNFYTDSTNYFNTDGNFQNNNIRPNIRLQGEYEFNKNNSLSAVVQTNYNYFDNQSFNQYTNLNKDQQIYKLSTRENTNKGNGYNNSLSLSYVMRGKNLAERLQLIASGNFGKNDNGRDFFQEFLRPDFQPLGIDSTQNQATDNFSNAYSLRANYDKPLKIKGWNISTGAFYSQNSNHNIFKTSFLKKPEQQLVVNDLLSTDFRFNQNISNVRAALSVLVLKNIRITAGAQAELTATQFEFLKGNTADVDNSYFNLLPNLTIRKEFNKTFNTSFVYRASIRRPGIRELNPSIDYGDPYNIRFGNPYLLPTLSHNYDWNVGLSKGKYYLNGSIGYNKVKDVFNTIRTLIESGRTQVTYQNISDRNEYETSIWGGYTFTKRFRINTSAGYSYNEYGDAERKLFKYRNGGSFYTSFNYTYTPNTLTTLEGNARYSSYADPQGRARSNLSMNLGIQRKLFNKRLIVSLNVIDPLRKQQFFTTTFGSNFTLENYNSTNTKNFRVSIAYQLNKLTKSKLSEKQKKAALDKLKSKAQQ